MRFIHIADVHLGAQPDAGMITGESRGREIWETFERVLRVCEEEKTDLLLIAGDLFHRQPLMRELKEVDYLFSRLSHTKVALIAGNHDYIRRDSNYRTFQWSENVFPLLGEETKYVDFPELGTAVYGMSYHQREITEPLFDSVRSGGVEPVEILLVHGGDERHVPFDKHALERSGFDYIALGHIHKPLALARDRIIYPGALEPVDQNDTGRHGYIKGETVRHGVRTQWVPCALREYVHLMIQTGERDTTGSVKEKISKAIDEYGNENIYKIVLRGRRDPDIVFDTERMKGGHNILDLSDETAPAYDFDRLCGENAGTILARFIENFRGCEQGSVEYQAMCEGVDALLKSRA